MTDFRSLLEALTQAQVEFIVVGGLAAVAHGSARLTQDIDVVYARDVFGQRVLCLALEKLIAVKRAAGRPRDLEALAELEALRDMTSEE